MLYKQLELFHETTNFQCYNTVSTTVLPYCNVLSSCTAIALPQVDLVEDINCKCMLRKPRIIIILYAIMCVCLHKHTHNCTHAHTNTQLQLTD